MNYTDFLDLLGNFTFIDVIDIIIIACIIYWIMKLIRQTRAEQLLKGLIILIISLKISEFIGLKTTYYILSNTMTLGVIALLVVFQPELRRALEKIGRNKYLSTSFFSQKEDNSTMIDEILNAVKDLSETKTGALIVIEKETGLQDLSATGTYLDCEITSELLKTIFFPNTPLHDGAVIIRDGKIHSAGCFLPLSDNPNISKALGTRHRAAIGVTEHGDCLVLIVSEETGTISIAEDGKLSRFLDISSVRERIKRSMELEETKFKFNFNVFGKKDK